MLRGFQPFRPFLPQRERARAGSDVVAEPKSECDKAIAKLRTRRGRAFGPVDILMAPARMWRANRWADRNFSTSDSSQCEARIQKAEPEPEAEPVPEEAPKKRRNQTTKKDLNGWTKSMQMNTRAEEPKARMTLL